MVPVEVLRTLFRLTPAETRLAQSILNGHSAAEAAELGGVSRETVKSQMNAIFSKTGTRRQGDLIRLLSRLPAQFTLRQ
jgi:DNA-binding CsgD family transcriptional regulator